MYQFLFIVVGLSILTYLISCVALIRLNYKLKEIDRLIEELNELDASCLSEIESIQPGVFCEL